MNLQWFSNVLRANANVLMGIDAKFLTRCTFFQKQIHKMIFFNHSTASQSHSLSNRQQCMQYSGFEYSFNSQYLAWHVCSFSAATIRYSSSCHQTGAVCWNCDKQLSEGDLFCTGCSCVQKPETEVNYFKIFGEDVHFDIDAKKLTQTFWQLQRLLHPDKFSTKSKKERDYSEKHSSLINNAYQILSKPLQRGLYLLELYGKPLQEGEIQIDLEFLTKIMEVNEVLSALPSIEEVKRIDHENQMCLSRCLQSLAEAFQQDNISLAQEILAEMKYYVNIDGKVKDIKMSHDIKE